MKGFGNRQKRVVVPKRVHVPPKPPKTNRKDQPPRRPGSRPQERSAGE